MDVEKKVRLVVKDAHTARLGRNQITKATHTHTHTRTHTPRTRSVLGINATTHTHTHTHNTDPKTREAHTKTKTTTPHRPPQGAKNAKNGRNNQKRSAGTDAAASPKTTYTQHPQAPSFVRNPSYRDQTTAPARHASTSDSGESVSREAEKVSRDSAGTGLKGGRKRV